MAISQIELVSTGPSSTHVGCCFITIISCALVDPLLVLLTQLEAHSTVNQSDSGRSVVHGE